LSHRNQTPTTAVRPFDHLRKGTALGDGGGLVVMESYESAVRRGAPIICEVLGAHSFCHSLHPTSPDPTGWDTFSVLKHSLIEAGMTPSEIDYVNAHAASNPMGDLPEAIGIEKIFGSREAFNSLEGLKNLNFEDTTPEKLNKEQSRNILVNTFKGNIGHPLLSSGSQEISLTIKTMMEVRYHYV
jgi:3-oxoacyl-[acyl-carrier-protein] synthase II